MFRKSDYLILSAAFVSFLFLSLCGSDSLAHPIRKLEFLSVSGCRQFFLWGIISSSRQEANSMSNVAIFAVGLFVTLLVGGGLLYTIIEMRGLYGQAEKRRSDG